MKITLYEDSRNALIKNMKSSRHYAPNNQYNGKNRYERRLKSRLESSIKNFNNINMDKFFKSDILDVNIDVNGETNEYVVRISFQGILDEIKGLLKSQDATKLNNIVDRRTITRALTRAFDKNDIYFNCSCPDMHYRHRYWATRNNMLIGTPENRPNQYDWTNKNQDMGNTCKHVTLALSDASWLIKVSSVIYNYINYMKDNNERLYEKFIFPAIYGIPYDDIQLDMEDDILPAEEDIDLAELQGFIDYDMANLGRLSTETQDLIDKAGVSITKDGDSYKIKGLRIDTDSDMIDRANQAAKQRGQFKKGNEFRFTREPKQITFDELENEEEE